MKINRTIRSGSELIDDYILELEDELLKKETSSIIKFITSANKVASALAEDMELMLLGEIEQCKILTDDKDSKLLDRLLNLLKNVETFDQISKIADGLVPEEVSEVNTATQLIPNSNAFEQIQEKIREKHRK